MPNLGIAGYYKLIIRDKDSHEPRQVIDWFPNLITDIGMDRLGTDGLGGQYCGLGSGTTAPSILDTGLQSPVGVKRSVTSSTYGAVTSVPYYGWKKLQWDFTPGQVTGNLSEITVSWNNDNTSAFSRTLITENGSPITISVLANDYLTVIYEFRVYPVTTDSSATPTIGGIEHACVIRASEINNAAWTGQWALSYGMTFSTSSTNTLKTFASDIGTIFTEPAGSSQSSTIRTLDSYVPGSYSRTCTYPFTVNQGNHSGGIDSVKVETAYGAWQVSFVPPIMKDINKTMNLRFTVTWARYTP